ncbi:MAG: hypothetical protein ACSHW1_11645 [Yoonia sp.]|uniref:hypothetical protein n=1 Tax=Yoonia sp. TaxID=2212373 RepID=UPI003EF39D8E
MQTAVLTTVNAPFQTYLDAEALAGAIMSGDIGTGQVGSFFTETAVDAQKMFAEAHGISAAALTKTATDFTTWSGQPVILAA